LKEERGARKGPRTRSGTSGSPKKGGGFENHVEELASKSKLAQEVQQDIEKHRDTIVALMKEIQEFDDVTMAELRNLHQRTDRCLESLADETMVLREFPWPHDKCASIREAVKRDESLEKMLAQCFACAKRCQEVENGQLGTDAEKQLGRVEAAFHELSLTVESLKRSREEMQSRYYKYQIPFDVGTITTVQERSLDFAKLHMSLTLTLVDAPALLNGGSKLTQANQKVQALLKAAFEFAFKVQQFANITDEEATVLFELLFAVIEKLHQVQKDKFRVAKGAAGTEQLAAVPEGNSTAAVHE